MTSVSEDWEPAIASPVDDGLDGWTDLWAFFEARSVAIVGASSDPNKVGGRPLAYLRRFGYGGSIHPVNRRVDEIDGIATRPDVASLPYGLDLAILAVDASVVASVVEACAARGIRNAIVFSSGFSEINGVGVQLQAELKRVARSTGVRILGPNSIGVISTPQRLTATFATSLELPGDLVTGDVALVSQSGALGAFIHAEAHRRGVGLSRFISVGNAMSIDVPDALRYLATDDATKTVGVYLEGLRDGRRFMAAARDVIAAGKSIHVMKVGTSELGQAAAKSHTGSLVGTDDVYDAAFHEVGIHRVRHMGSLVDVLALESHAHTRPRDGVAVMTISGGAGVWATDRLSELGVRLARLTPATKARLRETLPAFAAVENPVDVTGNVVSDTTLLPTCLKALLDDPGVGSVVILLGLQESRGTQIAESIRAVAAVTDTVIAVSWVAGPADGIRILNEAKIPCYDDMERCVVALGGAIAARPVARLQHLRWRTAEAPLAFDFSGELDEDAAKSLLEAHGVPTTRRAVVREADAAVIAAERLGYPVVLKVNSARIAHKSDLGLVRLDLGDEPEVRVAYAAIIDAAAATAAAGDPLIVEEHVRGGFEVIVGVVRDATFGPVVALGAGGVLAELLGKPERRIAPLSVEQAREFVHTSRLRPILTGYRGQPALDVEALSVVIARLSTLAWMARDRVREIEVNPLIVLPVGEGVRALDALVCLGEEEALP